MNYFRMMRCGVSISAIQELVREMGAEVFRNPRGDLMYVLPSEGTEEFKDALMGLIGPESIATFTRSDTEFTGFDIAQNVTEEFLAASAW